MKPEKVNGYSVRAQCADCGAIAIFDHNQPGGELGSMLRNHVHLFEGLQFQRVMWRLLRCSNCERGGLAKFHDEYSQLRPKTPAHRAPMQYCHPGPRAGVRHDHAAPEQLNHQLVIATRRLQSGAYGSLQYPQSLPVRRQSYPVETGLHGEHTVQIRFDDASAKTERWSDSTDNKAFFAPQPVAFARNVAKAKRLRFGFTPFNASPVIAEFDVSEFEAALKEIAETCRWSSHP